jgi:hypothetical protein
MPESVIRIDADVESVTVKLKKLGDAQKKAGENIAKGLDTGVGAIEKRVMGIVKGLTAAGLAAEAIGMAARASMRVQDANAGAAKGRNQFEMAAGAAALRAGGSPAANRAFIESNQSPWTTMQGRTGFLSGLAQIQEDRRARGLPQIPLQQIQQAQRFYNMGGDPVLGEHGEDILSAMREHPMQWQIGLGRRLAGRNGTPFRGQDIGSLIEANRAQLPGGTITAIKAQAMAELADRAQYERGKTGEADLMMEEERRRFAIDHPWGSEVAGGLRGAVGKIPIVGSGISSGIEAGQRLGEGKGALDHLKKISDDMGAIRRSSIPVLPNPYARQEPRK